MPIELKKASLLKAAGNINNSFAEKVTPVNDDILLIEDSEFAYNKKKVKVSSISGGLLAKITTSAYTAVAGDSILADTNTTAAFTVTLPIAAIAGDIIQIYDAKGTFAIANLTVARNGLNIRGVAADLTLDVNWSYVKLIYVDAVTGWRY